MQCQLSITPVVADAGYACNTINDPSLACNHNAWESYLPSGIPIMRFFVEPVVRAINYAGE